MWDTYLEKYKKLIPNEIIRDLLGYSFVGAISNILELGYLFLMKEAFGIWYLLASAIAFTIGSIQSFLARKFFVFKDPDLKKIYKQATLYIIIFFIGIALNLFIIFFLVEVLKIYYAIAYAVAVILTGVFGFLWNRYVTFKK